MLTVRRAEDRGHADHGWLNTHHTFSFADYFDPKHTGFRALRVINDDTVAPGRGFGSHPHRDMEILSYVLDGALAHKDSMGTGSVIRPGDLQRMSAGRGVVHSEFNQSPDEPVHFLQIWIQPDRAGVEPSYEQKTFADAEKSGRLRLVASHDGRQGSVRMHADANVYATKLASGQSVEHTLPNGRGAWVHVARGTARVVRGADAEVLRAGDAISTTDAGVLRIEGVDGAEVLVFDLA